MLGPKKVGDNKNIGANYNSNLFAAIGTLFLFMFWPSFNGALASGNQQHRVVVNTVLALCSSTIGAFFTSAMFNKGIYRMEDTLNATLTGGVIIGSSSDLVAASYVAVIIGFVGGVISTIGFNKATGYFYEKFGLHDTCGVHNLHGMPGIVGGIIGAISCGLASDTVYGDNLYEIFPELRDGRTKAGQMGYQFAALGSSVAISLLGGMITGCVIRCKCFDGPMIEDCFDDEQNFVMEEEEEPIDKKLTKHHIE